MIGVGPQPVALSPPAPGRPSAAIRVVTGSQDMEMDSLLASSPKVCCRVDEEPLPLADWYYLYRWGVSPCHLSGVPDMQGLYDSLGLGRPPAGRFVLAAALAARLLRHGSRHGRASETARGPQHGQRATAPAVLKRKHARHGSAATPPTSGRPPSSPASA